MKKEEVPQDNSFLTNSVIRELCYATDEEGNYTTVQSKGWKTKDEALQESIELINERIEEAIRKFRAGEASPLLYFMERARMDVPLLAAYVNKWKWTVKRHFKPSVFKSLPDKVLQQYADIFDITLDELKNFRGK